MQSEAKITHRQQFYEGMNTVVSPENAKNTQYIHSLNCDIVSSSEGNIGVITNIKGTVEIPVDLPAGENHTIGVGLDEERYKLYFAVWNSNGYHTWYEFDIQLQRVIVVLQCITDTGGKSIFNWKKDSVIIHIDIVENNLLYWTVKGDEARKFNIKKALDKGEEGYGIIMEEFTRAYKRPPSFPPEAEYFTQEDMLTNSVYGYLFKFSVQHIYDDGEETSFSDYSRVAIPIDENSAGPAGVPNKNNGIKVRFMTGGRLVRKIRLAMKKTNNAGGESDWVSIMVLDKKVNNVADDTEYEYEFFNNSSYIGLTQAEVTTPQSYLPREPEVQAFAGNAMIYGNFKIGRDAVDVDMSVDVSYSDLFIASEVENKPNSPSLIVNITNASYEGGIFARHTTAEVIIGPDVKKGNIYNIIGKEIGVEKLNFTVIANANDTSRTIAAQFHSKIANHNRVSMSGGWIEDIIEVGGSSKFKFNYKGQRYLEFTVKATPVNYDTLKDTGNSIPNDKMGSAYRYAIYYEDQDGRKSPAYGNESLVEIKSINDLGETKKVTTQLSISHRAPEWATKMGVVRTRNLNQLRFIQVLIQSINVTTTTTSGTEYHDLSLGSLYTYQQVHPNSTLTYLFEKGDRLRYIRRIKDGVETVPQTVIDYEVIAFYPEVTDEVNENITIDGSSDVATAVDPNRVGSHIVINNTEREIIAINSGGDKYILNSAIGTPGTPETFPSYTVINKQGIVRVKINDAYPIPVDAEEDLYAVVEIYKPYQSQANPENENYFDIGYKFDVKDGYHLGNVQDQSAIQPAIIQIDGLDNYVRKREMVTNLSVKNPSVVLVTVEDQSFSDFYVSDLSSYGRATVLDDLVGEVHFGDRLINSINYIEGTSINGLNMFRNLDRVDYNDKYGSISRIMYNEGRLYVFKHLKTCWGPIYGRVLTDDSGQEFLSASSQLLPEKLHYFLWEGGVGHNPECIVRDGNDLFGVSPNSGVMFRIGGNGVIPISKTFGVDNEARDIITQASKSGVKMFGGFNRKKGNYVLSIPAFDIGQYSATKTLVFNEDNNQFVGYRSYVADMTTRFIDEFISFKRGSLWIHDKAEERNTFYGDHYASEVTFYVNIHPDAEKDFFSIVLEGDQPWSVEVEIPSKLGTAIKKSRVKPGNFVFEKGNFRADFLRDMNDKRFNTELEALRKGAYLVGKYMKVTLRNNSTEPLKLVSASVDVSIK